MRRWLAPTLVGAPAVIALLVTWGDAPMGIRLGVFAACFAALLVARFVFAARLPFQSLLFARSLIWLMLFILLVPLIGLIARQLPDRAATAVVLFIAVFGAFGFGLMMLLAIGKPCPVCDGRSPIQFIKGGPWVGTESAGFRFFQSGIAERCPICDADWLRTESELRATRADKRSGRPES